MGPAGSCPGRHRSRPILELTDRQGGTGTDLAGEVREGSEAEAGCDTRSIRLKQNALLRAVRG